MNDRHPLSAAGYLDLLINGRHQPVVIEESSARIRKQGGQTKKTQAIVAKLEMRRRLHKIGMEIGIELREASHP